MRTGVEAFDNFGHLTLEDRQEIRSILEAAVEYLAGRLPVWEWAKIGSVSEADGRLSGPGRAKFVAMRVRPPTDPGYLPLIMATEELVKWRDGVLAEQARQAA